MTQTIKYELLIDTAKGSAQIKRALEEGASAAGGGAPGGGGGGGIGGMLAKGAAAAGPAGIAALAVAGAAVGGVVMLKKFTEQGLAATRMLSNYSASTFAATTSFDFFMEGLKFQVAGEIGPALSDLTVQVMDLISGVMPIVIDVLKGAIPVLTFALKMVTVLAFAYQVAWKSFMLGSAQILSMIPGTGFGTSDVSKAQGQLFEAMAGLTEAVTGNTQATLDQMRTGAMLSMGLFNAASAWSQTAAGHGPQAGAAEAMLAGDPGGGPVGAGGGRAGAARGMGGRGFPRPQPAAVHLKMADDIHLNATDEDKIDEQITLLKFDLLSQLSGMLDGRWLRVLTARQRNTSGFGL